TGFIIVFCVLFYTYCSYVFPLKYGQWYAKQRIIVYFHSVFCLIISTFCLTAAYIVSISMRKRPTAARRLCYFFVTFLIIVHKKLPIFLFFAAERYIIRRCRTQ